jgi:hypothetical protein
MKTKYYIIVGQRFFDQWLEEFNIWKTSTKNEDSKFIINLVEEFLNTADINKMIGTKYNDFEAEVYKRYITYIKNQIYKILPLAEEKGHWREHLDTLITELTGSDEIFLRTVNFISLINKLETLKKCPDFPLSLSLDEIREEKDFKVFRKTIFECMNIAESLSIVEGKNGN